MGLPVDGYRQRVRMDVIHPIPMPFMDQCRLSSLFAAPIVVGCPVLGCTAVLERITVLWIAGRIDDPG